MLKKTDLSLSDYDQNIKSSSAVLRVCILYSKHHLNRLKHFYLRCYHVCNLQQKWRKTFRKKHQSSNRWQQFPVVDYLFLFPFIVHCPLQNTLFTITFESSLVLILRHCSQTVFKNCPYRIQSWKQTKKLTNLFHKNKSRYTANKTRAWETEISIRAWIQFRPKPIYCGTYNTLDATNVKYKYKQPNNSCKIKWT